MTTLVKGFVSSVKYDARTSSSPPPFIPLSRRSLQAHTSQLTQESPSCPTHSLSTPPAHMIMNDLPTTTSRVPDPKATEDLDTPYPKDPRPLDPATIIREKTPAESTIQGAVPPSPLINPRTNLIPNVLTPADRENQYQGGDTPYPNDEPVSPTRARHSSPLT